MMPGSNSLSSSPRDHHWDAMRALLMLLGIPYHVAMAYRSGQGWIMTSGEGAPLFNQIAQVIHVVRMPAFFLIAGYFAALLLARRDPGAWLGSRAKRLIVPFIVVLLTLNPLLNLLCELSNWRWDAALLSWRHESATSGGYWVRHLWFLIVLLAQSAAATLACLLAPRLRSATLGARLDALLARHMPATMIATALGLGLWQASTIELFYKAGLNTLLLQQILRIDQMIEFAPWFLLGAIIARAPALRASLYRLSPLLIALTLAALITDLAVREQLWPPYGRFLDTLAGIGLAQLLLAGMKRLADRPNNAVRELVDASFVIYLVHLPIIAALVVLVGPYLALPLILKAPLFMALTLALSYAAWLLVKRSMALRFLFDGVWPERKAVVQGRPRFA